VKRPADEQHRICLCLGSNINPADNIHRAVMLLREHGWDFAYSSCYETQAVGSSGANFFNMAACLYTHLKPAAFKQQVIARIEKQLGRVRTADKNAPRTIDLDIIVYDNLVQDPQLWQQVYLALPISELIPELVHPESGETLPQVAQRLREKTPAALRPEVRFSP
jgi:2-amino-4-hydroxy-6-hydroxymethyldihydropteridine diphosphokinase